MVFANLFFLFAFLPAFILCYLLAKWLDRRSAHYMWRNLTLVVFSLLFYAWGEPLYVFLMLACVVVNYAAGRWIDRQEKGRKAALIAGLTFNIGILASFKYLPTGLALPIGISFYTFQSISYLVDVYRRESAAQRRLVDLLLYISMFPQLIAGPIVRYGSIASQLHDRRVTTEDMAEGSFRFLIGLGKKVILANQLSILSDNLLGSISVESTAAASAIGLLAFSMQIYFDFSGYSDMAIGIGRCLGFSFPENFNHPYCCTSITDFWRRWHMTLGTFFRDYVYIPLGGNRRHQALNILIVWFLTGMWHGASWNFVVWGLYFGLIVTVEKYTILRWRIPQPLMHIGALILVVLGWGIFYYDDFSQMHLFFTRLCSGDWSLPFVVKTTIMSKLYLIVFAILACLPLQQWIKPILDRSMALKWSLRLVISLCILTLSVALLVGATNNPFLYTRF